MKKVCSALSLFFTLSIVAQNNDDNLPYYEIPEYSDTYTAGTVAARMIDGLGFRFYWATDGLTEEDLSHKPIGGSRSTGETVDHVLTLSYVILSAALHQPYDKKDTSQLSFVEKRKQTLINLKTAADILRDSDDVSKFVIVFGERENPFWNAINGPIADAIWHSGQIASYRRTSGNPINSDINHFTGTVKKQ